MAGRHQALTARPAFWLVIISQYKQGPEQGRFILSRALHPPAALKGACVYAMACTSCTVGHYHFSRFRQEPLPHRSLDYISGLGSLTILGKTLVAEDGPLGTSRTLLNHALAMLDID
jgi:hypothetical protein